MYKFVLSSICLAVLFGLAQPSALQASGSESKQGVRTLEKQVATLVADDIAPDQRTRDVAKQVLSQGLEIVSEVIKSTAWSLCPDSENQDQRQKRSLSTELERDIFDLLMRGDDSIQKDPILEDDIQKVVKDLAKAIKDDIDSEAGKAEPNDFIVSQLAKVLESTLQAIVAISSSYCPSSMPSERGFCDTSIASTNNACVQLRSLACRIGASAALADNCAEAREFCFGSKASSSGTCKRLLCMGATDVTGSGCGDK